jgi:hypothetical protein
MSHPFVNRMSQGLIVIGIILLASACQKSTQFGQAEFQAQAQATMSQIAQVVQKARGVATAGGVSISSVNNEAVQAADFTNLGPNNYESFVAQQEVQQQLSQCTQFFNSIPQSIQYYQAAMAALYQCEMAAMSNQNMYLTNLYQSTSPLTQLNWQYSTAFYGQTVPINQFVAGSGIQPLNQYLGNGYYYGYNGVSPVTH